jgi:hypothetical protein
VKLVPGVIAAGGCLLVAAPVYAEPVPIAEGVAQIEAACVASRAAFLDGGVVVLREKPKGKAVQVQRFDPVRGRVSDSGWPSIIVRGVGTYDRSGFVLDARLRKAQVRQAANYLGFSRRPWVLTKKQFGVVSSGSFRQFLRIDVLAPDRFVDLDSTTVPAQPQRCASHLLAADAKATLERTVVGDVTTWNMSYRLDDDALPVKVTSSLTVRDGLIVAGTAALRGQRGAGLDLDNYATWKYGRPDVALPARRDVVSQQRWIRASDAAALVTDVRYLAGSLEGRRTLTGLRKVARERARLANRGHEVPIRVRNVAQGVELYGRNPYTDEVVRFEVVLEPVPTATSRRVR